MQVEHHRELKLGPAIDWSRTLTVWDDARERDALYVLLETGEWGMTWVALASLANLIEAELHERVTRRAHELTILARHGEVTVPCVSMRDVAAFLAEIGA